MKTKQKKSLEDLVMNWAKENIMSEVEKLKACTMVTEIDKKYPLRKGCNPGKSNACVLVYISDEDANGGDAGELIYDVFNNKPDPPGVPIGQFVAELVEDFSEGSRLECIKEIRESLLKIEERIKEGMLED